jgi:NAD(P)-dependent dehydrogenase (short-subunit alcohol dehydrogenase family)
VDRSYVIVGGTSGIGAAVVKHLAGEGINLVQLSRHPERAPDGRGIRNLRWDAETEPFPSAGLPDKLDGLVYCPGSIRLKPFARLRESDFREDLEVNLFGAVRAIDGCLSRLQSSESASIILFSTVAVGTGMPYHASIAAAKGAVEGLARALAAELAPRIRVNVVAPTLTDTPLAERLLSSEEKRRSAAERHPLKAIGRPEDVARSVLWLLQDAPMLTGQVIRCDGGMSALRLL